MCAQDCGVSCGQSSSLQAAHVVDSSKRVFCHNPYTLPQFNGRTWESTWMDSQPPLQTVAQEAAPYPLQCSHLGYVPLSASDESLPQRRLSSSGSSSDSSSKGNSVTSSRFPVSIKGRCPHRDHWLRLRGKRGYTYFLCTHCLCGWRKPRENRQ